MIRLALIISVTLVALTSCNETNKLSTDSICIPDPMPKYDYRATVRGEMTAQMESDLRIEKRRVVFKPCRTHVFNIEFLSENKKLISNEKISFTPTGKRWKHQPEKQDEIIIKYEFNIDSIDQINQNQLNKERISSLWQTEESTGVIENIEKIWMHPFRSNQYNFTQVSPFPQVELPIKIGKTWIDNNISLKDGFGDWSNMKIRSNFEVISRETIVTKFSTLENCWKIRGKSNFELGQSILTYWFNENYGFVKMEYQNYGNQKLNIELIDILEKSR